jgi:hypothetical protein
MAEKKLFIIPIYLIDSEEEEEREKLGIDEDKPMTINQTTLETIYISSFWRDPNKNRHTGTKDIVFYVDGVSFRTPYSEKIINEVLRPAMHIRAALNDEQPQFITGPN